MSLRWLSRLNICSLYFYCFTDVIKILHSEEKLFSHFVQTSITRPESYASWKAAFPAINRKLEITPIAKIDLLVKWTGPESHKHTIRIEVILKGDSK